MIGEINKDWAEAIGKDPRLAAFREDADAPSVVCSLHGHAVVVTSCFGYIHCDRCGDQVGDTLGGSFETVTKVVRNHGCETCDRAWEAADFWAKFGVKPDGTGFLQQSG